jgi:hypothetical protein
MAAYHMLAFSIAASKEHYGEIAAQNGPEYRDKRYLILMVVDVPVAVELEADPLFKETYEAMQRQNGQLAVTRLRNAAGTGWLTPERDAAIRKRFADTKALLGVR